MPCELRAKGVAQIEAVNGRLARKLAHRLKSGRRGGLLNRVGLLAILFRLDEFDMGNIGAGSDASRL
ncbi:MAG: hypothetical protein M5U26_02135 [Planctomycetota bacterium]|nr:hypothetical protein [Planctomycetota bacterium]